MIAHHHAEKEAEQQAQSNEQAQYEEQPAAPPEAEEPPAEPTMEQKIRDIEGLEKLRDSGALTEEEFAEQKQRILDS